MCNVSFYENQNPVFDSIESARIAFEAFLKKQLMIEEIESEFAYRENQKLFYQFRISNKMVLYSVQTINDCILIECLHDLNYVMQAELNPVV